MHLSSLLRLSRKWFFSCPKVNRRLFSKMPKSCCAIGCTNRYKARSGNGFYRLPSEAKCLEMRRKWIAAIRRKNWTPKKEEWVSSKHFIVGKRSCDQLSPASVPQLFEHNADSWLKDKLERDLTSYERRSKEPQANT